ncbi:MAG TPA: hypothetical protein VHO69_13350, partial [Phototrophicaceae bacterium]|nr:hypothetical protein [Phototrophicaceae bacterium]
MDQPLQPLITRQRLGLLAALFTLLAGIYLLTYSGRIESGDTLSLFDAATSLYYYGDDLFDQSVAVNMPPSGADNRLYPLTSIEVEPLHDLLALGLINVADRLPGVGLVHTVWLLNIFLSAAAVGTLFVYALALGYSEITGVLAALIFGLATILWPYSKTFFREPLALWLTLLAALMLERWRTRRYRSVPLLIGSGLALGGAFFSKEAVVFAIPSLILIALPTLPVLPHWLRRLERWALRLVLLGVALFIVTSIFAQGIDFAPMYVFLARLSGQRWWHIARMHSALHSYLLSPGGSIWGTSPVVLLALPGMWRLYRSGRTRYLWVPLLMLLAFAGGYTYLRGIHWFGGLSWPPRFLMPVVPFLLLAALPVLERLTRKPWPKGWMAGGVLLIGYSVWVQLSGVTLPWGAYTAALPTEANGLSEWGGGLNVVQYFRWFVIPGLWSQ